MKMFLVDGAFTITVPEGECFLVDEKLHALLETFPNRKMIVTNANDEQMKKFGLDAVPYEVFTLKHRPDKIDPVYFETLLRHFNLRANEAIYFEHDPQAVKSAESVGIVSYHFDAEKRDLEALQGFLVKNLK